MHSISPVPQLFNHHKVSFLTATIGDSFKDTYGLCLHNVINTIGDPFKDTSSLSLGNVIKFMHVQSLVFAPDFVMFNHCFLHPFLSTQLGVFHILNLGAYLSLILYYLNII